MSATATLKAARAAGIKLEVDGGDLVLEASAPPPPALLDLISRHKADIVELLWPECPWPPVAADWRTFIALKRPPPTHPGERAEAIAYQARLVEWLNANPASSAPDRCAECGRADTPGAALVPFGFGPHTTLHTDCWARWYAKRIVQATTALAGMGVMVHPFHRIRCRS